MKYTLSLVLLMSGFSSFGFDENLKIQILNPELAAKSSYLSPTYEGVVPFWTIEGQIYSTKSALKLIREEGKTGCTTWLLNFSDDKNVSLDEIQKSLFVFEKIIPLWKIVNQVPIFSDDKTSFALIFVCVKSDENEDLIEIENADLGWVFNGIYSFKK
jgi:hypothetical protein